MIFLASNDSALPGAQRGSTRDQPRPMRTGRAPSSPTALPRGQFGCSQFQIDQQLLATGATLCPCGQIPQPRAPGYLPLPWTEMVLAV